MTRAAPFRLYLVTDRTRTNGRPLLEVVEAALGAGVEAVQLREKTLPTDELVALARPLVTLCRRYGARLLINDRIDVALAVGADGVHLPTESFEIADAQRLLGDAAIIGASTHHLDEARAAATKGADFVVFGPIFDTPSKRAFGPPVGLAALRELTQQVQLPVIAIGGIDEARVGSVLQHGASGIAVVSAILGAEHPAVAAARLRALL